MTAHDFELTTYMTLEQIFEVMQSGAPVTFGEICRKGVIRSLHRDRKDRWTCSVWDTEESETFTVYLQG